MTAQSQPMYAGITPAMLAAAPARLADLLRWAENADRPEHGQPPLREVETELRVMHNALAQELSRVDSADFVRQLDLLLPMTAIAASSLFPAADTLVTRNDALVDRFLTLIGYYTTPTEDPTTPNIPATPSFQDSILALRQDYLSALTATQAALDNEPSLIH